MYMDNIKQFKFAKNKKERETDIRSGNIQSWHIDGIWQRKMYHASNEKQ